MDESFGFRNLLKIEMINNVSAIELQYHYQKHMNFLTDVDAIAVCFTNIQTVSFINSIPLYNFSSHVLAELKCTRIH